MLEGFSSCFLPCALPLKLCHFDGYLLFFLFILTLSYFSTFDILNIVDKSIQMGGMKLTKVIININSIDRVKDFVNTISRFSNDFDLVSGRYVIDAKSIMGIFSLDLSNNLELNIQQDDNISEILDALKDFIVE